MAQKPIHETVRDVILAAAEASSQHEPPTAREAMQMMIRMECARAGLPKPDFDAYPQSDLRERIAETMNG